MRKTPKKRVSNMKPRKTAAGRDIIFAQGPGRTRQAGHQGIPGDGLYTANLQEAAEGGFGHHSASPSCIIFCDGKGPGPADEPRPGMLMQKAAGFNDAPVVMV